MGDIAFEISSDAFQSADRDRSAVQATPAACGFAWPVAGASQNGREHIGLPVDHIRLCVLALGDEANILRHVGVRRASPLAIDYLVEVIRVANVASLQNLSPEI
jgi:hypothetical protein